MEKILIFSPFQGIPEHSFVERKLLDTLVEKNFCTFDVMTCDGALRQFCTAMAANKVSFASSKVEKEKICQKCKAYRNQNYPKNFPGKVLSLDTEVDAGIQGIIDSESERIKTELHQYQYNGVNLGAISSYELILSHKLKGITNLPEEVKLEYIECIKNNLKVFLVMEKIFSNSRYDRVIFYNGNYVVNNTVINLLQKKFPQINHTLIHFGLNWASPRDKLFLIKAKHQEHLRDRIQYFEDNQDKIDLSKYEMTEIDEYIDALQTGSSVFVYSSAKSDSGNDIFQKLKLDSDKPTALLSIASMDEIFALQFAVFQTPQLEWVQLTFEDQVEWIRETVRFFSNNPQWQLILRIHPREFPNKREKTLSKFAKLYQEMAGNLPPNIALNVPDQKISIYDLFEVVNLNLTSWSSVGLESALFGLPTISTTKGIGLYPCEYVHFFYKDPQLYFLRIKEVLSCPRFKDLQQIERAKKWILYDFNHTVIKMNTHRYWETKPSFLLRVINKLITPTSLYSYKKYSRKCQINEFEKNIALQFFKTGKEVFELKTENGTGENDV